MNYRVTFLSPIAGKPTIELQNYKISWGRPPPQIPTMAGAHPFSYRRPLAATPLDGLLTQSAAVSPPVSVKSPPVPFQFENPFSGTTCH